MSPPSLVPLASLLLAVPAGILLPIPQTLRPLPVILAQTTQDRKADAMRLNNEGEKLRQAGQYRAALEKYQQALTVVEIVGDLLDKGAALNNIGLAYRGLGQNSKSLEVLQQALRIFREKSARQVFPQESRAGEGKTLNNIGAVYRDLGQYSQALEFYQQALSIHREVGNRSFEGTLNNIGAVYRDLGQYSQALEFYQQALSIHREVGNRSFEGTTLNNIGAVYDILENYSRALEFYQQALSIHREVGNYGGEGATLDNIGMTYKSLGQYSQALVFHQQALLIRRKIGDRDGEGTTLNNIGVVYQKLKQYSNALDFFQQALTILKQVEDYEGESSTLSNIGYSLNSQKQTELAIVFYKQSINVTETIRQDIRKLPREQQESYIKSVADTYRSLADLLLKQDRVLEAQRVLDLLKVQELNDYFRNVRGNAETAQGIPNRPPEQQIVDRYTQSHITQQQAFEQFIRSREIQQLIAQLSPTAQKQSIDLEDFRSITSTLTALHQDAVLLYPLILPDLVELVLLAPGLEPIHRSYPVKKEELNRAIADFRTALQNPNSDAKAPAHQLYQWLIAPIAADLTRAKAKTILYAPDGQLRYIPLAALYDGQHWLAEIYRIQNITAKSLISLSLQRQTQPKVLAAAFSKGHYSFRVGSESFTFTGLPGARSEIALLASLIPGTTQLLDQEFTPKGVLTRLNNYNILHLATHGAIVTSDPTQSFILFGDGNPVNLTQIDSDWSFQNTDLVVLSACETGLGGLGNGEEILGLGYVMQKAGAKSAIASLWQVNDYGTQALMDAFYAALKSGKLTKAEALQQAQIALITSKVGKNSGGNRARMMISSNVREKLSKQVNDNLSHPYYWAPFILIGNGL